MPGTQRRIDPSLIGRLQNEPYRFEFFQAVRILLSHCREYTSAHQDRDILGQIIQFRSSVSLGFPPSEIESLIFEKVPGHESASLDCSDNLVRNRFLGNVAITPSFIGLTGPMGVMPRHYTDYVAEREIFHRDTATRAFLDIFSSRAVALFYQAWLKHRLHIQYETDRKNRFLPMVLSLAGFGLTGMQHRLQTEQGGIADETLAYYASALRERPQPAGGFALVVADYFKVTCKVQQFVGQWIELPASELTRLGSTNCELGQSSFCGGRVWDRNARIRILIGPLRKQQFEDFLPGKPAASSLQRFFHLMVGLTCDCEVQLILDRRDLLLATLDSRSTNARLGWNGWLGSRVAVTDSHEVAYLMSAANIN